MKWQSKSTDEKNISQTLYSRHSIETSKNELKRYMKNGKKWIGRIIRCAQTMNTLLYMEYGRVFRLSSPLTLTQSVCIDSVGCVSALMLLPSVCAIPHHTHNLSYILSSAFLSITRYAWMCLWFKAEIFRTPETIMMTSLKQTKVANKRQTQTIRNKKNEKLRSSGIKLMK